MLSESAVRAARPREKAYKLKDERGLYLLVTPKGAKLWRLRYRLHGRETMLGLGSYPDVGLKDARDRRDEARKNVAGGRDPAAARRAEREGRANTFAAIAEEWLGRQRVADSTRHDTVMLFAKHINPWIGAKPVTAVTAPDVTGILKRMDARELGESARRAKRYISRVLKYAIATGRGAHDVTADLVETIEVTPVEHYAAITDPWKLGALAGALDTYSGQPSTVYALRLLPYLFVRPSELRRARWEQVRADIAEWRIPKGAMKMKEYHVVPLSRQALAIIEELREVTGAGPWLFPSFTGQARPMGGSTLRAALRRAGVTSEEHTVHGFRSTADTLLNELGWPPDAIELQLAHKERNKVRSAYNRAQHMALRRRMMQAWADYVDCLKRGELADALEVGAYRAISETPPAASPPRAG
jgi:integrase